MKKGNLITGVVGLAIGLVAVYVYVYVAGKGWQKSQKTNGGGFLNADGGGMYGLGCKTCRSSKDGSTYGAVQGYCRYNDTCITSIRPRKTVSIT